MADFVKIDFDPVVLRKKYRQERDRRVRGDGESQWLEIREDGPFAHFLVDPYVEPLVRDPLQIDIDVLVLGGGFSGLIAGAYLTNAGIRNFKIIEKGGGFGGTWWWNRYPGAMCDTESYCYLPLLEETNYVPVEKYTKAPEILAHCDRIAKQYDLDRTGIFQTETSSMTWDDTSSRWIVKTNRDDTIRARFVLQSTGALEKPKLPGAPGIEGFKGHTFHTSRWDYKYTGGSSKGGLVNLKDKTVGIIGTGATAIQCIPHLGEWSNQLYVFQRTPSSVDVRGNRPTDPEWAKTLGEKWQRKRMDNFTAVVSGSETDENLVNDGWTLAFGLMFKMMRENKKHGSPLKSSEVLQLADFMNMERIRKRVDEIVKDPETAEALKPYYNQFCKRPCFHDEYLPTFNRPNVKLVDTKGKGIERVTENGVVVDGKEYKVDCLIFATGFFATLSDGAMMTVNAKCPVYGRGGRSLEEKWKTEGFSSIYGIHTRGFPNYFFVQYFSQAAQFANAPHLLELQISVITNVIIHAVRNGVDVAEVSQKAEDAWIKHCVQVASLRNSFYEECTPGYYNMEGRADLRKARNVVYGAGPVAYTEILRKFVDNNKFEGFEFTKKGGSEIRASL